VRQLYNAILQAAVMAENDTISTGDLAAAIVDMPGSRPESVWDVSLGDGFRLEEHLKSIQRQFLQRAMIEANGVKKHAAALLGYENYQTLDAQLKRLGISLPRFARGGYRITPPHGRGRQLAGASNSLVAHTPEDASAIQE
jgi:DNA-binding NtrC family response regulator